jgi:carboxypeptidase T
MGTEPFSEPETQAIRNFVGSQENAKILLSFHTFSELILYPWGHTYEPITDAKDRSVFEKMAITMAKWNQYAPQSSSDLYIASGDTVDWAYGEHRIFAFTFELSPKSMWNGGFYPGAGIIDKVFQDNLQPCLYLMDMAGNPYQVLENEPTGWLRSYVEPRTPELFMRHPDIQNI